MARLPKLLTLLLWLAACGGPGLDGASSDDLSGTLRVRVMAGNITSGNRQSYDPGEGIRLFQGAHPDVALVQEMNYGANGDADVRAFVDRAFGSGFRYAREGGAQIPNGVVSRWPIAASGSWRDPNVSNRSFVWARIPLPGARPLWAVSVHLLTSGIATRDAEARELISQIRAAVPAGDYVVVGGDFNTGTRTETCLQTFGGYFDVSGPYPADSGGNENTSAARSKPYDWVLASTSLRPYQVPVVIGSSRFGAGLVLDSRLYSPLAEIAPALASDSGASNMQHMAVIKDFAVPASRSAPPPLQLTAPNGGETWSAGTARSITWTGGSGAVRIELSLDDGATWTALATNVSGTSWTWMVPASPAAAARVRVIDLADSIDRDASDAAFTIAAAPAADGFEPDDSAAAAKAIDADGAAQIRDIAPAADQDWVKFTLASARTVNIATNGPAGGDTYVYLYDSAQKLLGSDDDSGPGYYSLLTRAVPAGTYFVKVTSYQGASMIRGYSLRVTTAP